VHPCDILDPALQREVDVVDVFALASRQRVALHVLDRGLDFALLPRCPWWCRIDLQTVMTCELSVASIQLRVPIRVERRTGHRRFEVVRHDDLRHSAEGLEGTPV